MAEAGGSGGLEPWSLVALAADPEVVNSLSRHDFNRWNVKRQE